MASTTFLIFNGLHFPVNVIDTAIGHAQTSNSLLSALFIVAHKNQDDGYPFPNDLDQTETPASDASAVSEDLAIIFSNIRLLRRQTAFAKIELQTSIVPAPDSNTLRDLIASAGYIFVADNTLDRSLLSIDPDTISDALEGLSARTDWMS